MALPYITVLFLLPGTLCSGFAESPVPISFPEGRYSTMSAQCPFAVATPVAPVAAPQASFAANWFVSGVGRWNDEDYVTIKARDLSQQFSLFGHEPDAKSGVVLASVNWSDTVGKTTVVLQKGTETAKLEFNEAEVRNPPAAAAGSKASSPAQPKAPLSQASPVSTLRPPITGAIPFQPRTLTSRSSPPMANRPSLPIPGAVPRRRPLPIPTPRLRPN